MKSISIPLIFLAAFLLSACDSVTCKKPVGERIVELDPKLWNAKWADSDGLLFESSIKNLELGVVTLTMLRPTKPDEPKSLDVIVRNVSGQTVVSSRLPKDAVYIFGRIAITGEHLAIFAPAVPIFSRLIESKILRGAIKKNADGKPTGSCTIDELSERNIQSLEDLDKRDPTTFRFDHLFENDPYIVALRVKQPNSK